MNQPRSGERMQPTACPERSRRGISRGSEKLKKNLAPEGVKENAL
jgi:hypothetical protein